MLIRMNTSSRAEVDGDQADCITPPTEDRLPFFVCSSSLRVLTGPWHRFVCPPHPNVDRFAEVLADRFVSVTSELELQWRFMSCCTPLKSSGGLHIATPENRPTSRVSSSTEIYASFCLYPSGREGEWRKKTNVGGEIITVNVHFCRMASVTSIRYIAAIKSVYSLREINL